MSTRKLGYVITIFGAFVALAALLVDYLGRGDHRLGGSQILGLGIGLLTALFGFSLAIHYPDKKIDLRDNIRILAERISAWPVSVWVVIGFLIVYILFYLSPVFLNTERSMMYFNKYMPNRSPIGLDMNTTMMLDTSWLTKGESPYPYIFYPPLAFVLFAPLSLLSYPAYYIVITFMTLFCFCALLLLGLFLIAPVQDYSLALLFFCSGLISYGFQFELERGQFNVITFFICILAIFIYHKYHEFRYLAYLLFSFSIHLKIYPVIFVVMFIKDWRDWKNNLKRFLGLGVFNFILLFVLGFDRFIGFIQMSAVNTLSDEWSWNGNHSIKAFVANLLKDGYGIILPGILTRPQSNARLIELLLLAVVMACIISIIVRAYLRRENGFNPFLCLACTIGALTIIPISYDYTLSILVAPLAILFCSLPTLQYFRNRFLSIILILISAVAYASLLYPFKYKPYFLSNSFPPMFVILVAVTILYFLKQKPADLKTADLEMHTS